MRRGALLLLLFGLFGLLCDAAWTAPARAQEFDWGGQVKPYPPEDCESLRARLETAVPVTGAFSAAEEWFREEDLGLKGIHCAIAADGPARTEKGLPAPDFAAIAAAVTRVLEEAGFEGGKLLGRFAREAPGHRAFAMRDARTTCWVNLWEERAGPAALPPFYRLMVGCYLG